MKEKVKDLEKKLNDHEKSSKAIIDSQRDEINQLRKNIEQKPSIQPTETVQKKEVMTSITAPIIFNKVDGIEFNGIINFLKNNYNIKDVIDITYSSDNNDGFNSPFDLIDYNDTDKRFCTKNLPDSWICIEFKKHRITPYCYTIRSNSHRNQNFSPISWVIEGLDEKDAWHKISEVKESSHLVGLGVVHTFGNLNPFVWDIKCFRIRQTGPNCKGTDNLYFNSIEIYGKLSSY